MANESDIQQFDQTSEEEIFVPALDVMSLFAQVPPGHWIAASHDGDRVIAYAKDLHTAIEEARRLGESTPLVLRHPEEITFIY